VGVVSIALALGTFLADLFEEKTAERQCPSPSRLAHRVRRFLDRDLDGD
jgi:hypothetical protein